MINSINGIVIVVKILITILVLKDQSKKKTKYWNCSSFQLTSYIKLLIYRNTI